MVHIKNLLLIFSLLWAFSGQSIEFFRLPVSLDSTSEYSSSFTGSTSCGMTVEVGGRPTGAFYPQCSATNPNTEVAVFRLATVLDYADYVQAAVPAELGSDGIGRFLRVISGARLRNSHQIKNCRRVQEAVQRGSSNPDIWERTAGSQGWLPGVYKDWGKGKPSNYDSFVSGNAINSRNVVARLVQAGSTLTGRRIDIGEGRMGIDVELAKSASIMMTLDALFGQWDRYSGGNVQILKKADGNYIVFTADNGGALLSNGTNWVSKSISWHSRYDRNVIAKLQSILNFLENGGNFEGATTSREFGEQILGLRGVFGQSVDSQVGYFKRNLQLLLSAVNNNVRRYGEDQVYFP